MEVSVSFTDGSRDLNIEAACRIGSNAGSAERTKDTRRAEQTEAAQTADRVYDIDRTVMGRAWIPREGLEISPPVRVRYEKHPWITAFEFDGLRAAPARRTGIGNKGAKGFVKSLSTIYSKANDNYRAYGGDECFDAGAYFSNAAKHFASMASDPQKARLFSKFCGFAENMWREGDEEMLRICLDDVLPALLSDATAGEAFEKSITAEFRAYLEGSRQK